MECRMNCGACCIALSISSKIPGMPDGKRVGERCIHLMDDYRCALFNDPSRPKVCGDFKAEDEFCGTNREEALKILYSLSDLNPYDYPTQPSPNGEGSDSQFSPGGEGSAFQVPPFGGI